MLFCSVFKYLPSLDLMSDQWQLYVIVFVLSRKDGCTLLVAGHLYVYEPKNVIIKTPYLIRFYENFVLKKLILLSKKILKLDSKTCLKKLGPVQWILSVTNRLLLHYTIFWLKMCCYWCNEDNDAGVTTVINGIFDRMHQKNSQCN